jgi:hypothetical protein
MQLVKDEHSVWETHMVKGYPFGIEKIAPRDYVVFRLFGSRRIYLREDGFTSKAQAMAYLENDVKTYKNSIITALEESN